MMFSPGSTSSVTAFAFIVVSVVIAILVSGFVATARESGTDAAAKATLRLGLGLAAWLSMFSLLAISGILERHPLPLIPITFAAMLLPAAGLAFSPWGTRIARQLPLFALVGFHGFRLPLELVLHAWAETGTVPSTMTWTGANFDIVTGLAAVLLAPAAGKRAIAWFVNALGFVLLMNVLRVVVMSSPVPFGWPVQPKIMLIAHFPYVLIGPVCVAGALAGHIILPRKLLMKR